MLFNQGFFLHLWSHCFHIVSEIIDFDIEYSLFSKISKIHHPTWNKVYQDWHIWINSATMRFSGKDWAILNRPVLFFHMLDLPLQINFPNSSSLRKFVVLGGSIFDKCCWNGTGMTAWYNTVVKIFQLTTKRDLHNKTSALQFQKGFIMDGETNSSGKNYLLQWTAPAVQNLRGSAP